MSKGFSCFRLNEMENLMKWITLAAVGPSAVDTAQNRPYNYTLERRILWAVTLEWDIYLLCITDFYVSISQDTYRLLSPSRVERRWSWMLKQEGTMVPTWDFFLIHNFLICFVVTSSAILLPSYEYISSPLSPLFFSTFLKTILFLLVLFSLHPPE